MSSLSVTSANKADKPKQKFKLTVTSGTKKLLSKTDENKLGPQKIIIGSLQKIPRVIGTLKVKSGKMYDIDGLFNPPISPNTVTVEHSVSIDSTKTWDLATWLTTKDLQIRLRIDDILIGDNVEVRDYCLQGNWGSCKTGIDSTGVRYLDLANEQFVSASGGKVTYPNNVALEHKTITGAVRPGFKTGANYTTFYLWKPRSIINTSLQDRVLFSSNALETYTIATGGIKKLNGKPMKFLDRVNTSNNLITSESSTSLSVGTLKSTVSKYEKNYPGIVHSKLKIVDNTREPDYSWQTLITVCNTVFDSVTSKYIGLTKYYINGRLVGTTSDNAAGYVIYRLGLRNATTISTNTIHYGPGYIAEAGVLNESLNDQDVFWLHLNLYGKIDSSVFYNSMFVKDSYLFKNAVYNPLFVEELPDSISNRLTINSNNLKSYPNTFIDKFRVQVATTSKVNKSRPIASLSVRSKKLLEFSSESGTEQWVY